MKLLLLTLFVIFFVTGCIGRKSLKKYYFAYLTSNANQFKGYRFVCDSIGDERDVISIANLGSIKASEIAVSKAKINWFVKQSGQDLKKISFSDYLNLPLYDSSVKFYPGEIAAANELGSIHELLVKDSISTTVYQRRVDSVCQTEDLHRYLVKESARKRMLVILYPAIRYKDSLLIACRFYHTGMTSDAGSIIYKVFPFK